MKNVMKRMIMISLMAMFMVSGLAGCSTKFDAAQFVKGALDASYKNETTKVYVDHIELDEEGLKQQYKDQVERITGIADMTDNSEETLNTFRTSFENFMRASNYTAGEAVETEEGYLVTVTIVPLNNSLGQIETEARAKLDEWIAANMDGINPVDITENFLLFMAEGLNHASENPVYGDPLTVEVRVIKDGSEYYEIPDEDWFSITEKLFAE